MESLDPVYHTIYSLTLQAFPVLYAMLGIWEMKVNIPQSLPFMEKIGSVT